MINCELIKENNYINIRLSGLSTKESDEQTDLINAITYLFNENKAQSLEDDEVHVKVDFINPNIVNLKYKYKGCDPEDSKRFFNSLLSISSEILTKHNLNIGFDGIRLTKSIKLNEMNTILSIKGDLNCLIAFSVNKSLSERLLNEILLDECIELDEYQELIIDNISEFSNIIVGNSFKRLNKNVEKLILSTPFVFKTKQDLQVNFNNDVYFSEVDFEENNIKVFMLKM